MGASYKPALWWWEVAESVRRLCLSGLLVIVSDGGSGAGGALLGTLLSLASVKAFAYFRPFLSPGLNSLSEFVQVVAGRLTNIFYRQIFLVCMCEAGGWGWGGWGGLALC